MAGGAAAGPDHRSAQPWKRFRGTVIACFEGARSKGESSCRIRSSQGSRDRSGRRDSGASSRPHIRAHRGIRGIREGREGRAAIREGLVAGVRRHLRLVVAGRD
ncbi:hypothetical protein GCM10023214_04950 [Amycolatopsis dongchuanensis]|uniref:Uncharacterized protein n=1 Tax=Amycolatopsis dongchuanensis TaxID=1070866 RepID=A0ABP9PV64_9PSEU